jgi:hypothetical protein
MFLHCCIYAASGKGAIAGIWKTYQRWLATINQVCGHFAARPLEGRFHGEIDARYAGFDHRFAGELKHGIEPGVVIAFYLIARAVEIDAGGGVSTVTAAGVNLYRTRNEIKRDNDAWFYTVFQLADVISPAARVTWRSSCSITASPASWNTV